MPPAVSVNLCCYNGERYLAETLDSIGAQTYKDWELVIVDDGSIDSTGAIVKRYLDAGWPIRYHWQKNMGLGCARNKCIELSSGRYIALIDQDDLWLPDKLERQVRAMDDGISALCYGGVMKIDGQGKPIGYDIPKKKSGHLFAALLMQFDINVPTAMIRKAALEDANLNFDANVTASEEYCLFMQLAVKTRFIVISDVLAKYRIHDGALTGKSIARWADEREYTLELIKKNNPGIEEQFQAAFREAWARARYYRARYFLFQGKKSQARSEMRKNIFIAGRYFALYLLLHLPRSVWDFVHRLRSGRNYFG